MFQSPGAILVKLGPITIRWYGVMIALGFLAATAMAMRKAYKWSISPDKILNCALSCFVGGIIGARLYFVALQWSYFGYHPMEIPALWNGGLSIHGGFIGGIIGGLLYCKASKLPVLTACDLLGSSMPLAQSIGRWGNFFNSEAFGKPVSESFPLRLYIPPENRPSTFSTADFFHPTFLYESVWDLLLFVICYFALADRLRNYPGVTFCLYIGGYSIGRLLIEPLRTDSLMAFGIPAPMLASALMLGIAMVGLLVLLKHHWSNAQKQAD